MTRSEHGPLILALWCAHTHALEQLYSTPRIIVTSAAPECGKTTLLDHLERRCATPLLGTHATPALLARSVSAGTRSLLLVEVDNLLHARREGTPDLLAVLNSGYRRGDCRPVLVPIKDGWRTSKMPTYSAAALAGIGSGDTLPDAVLSRSVVIELDRALEGEIERTEWRDLEPDAQCRTHRLAVGHHLSGDIAEPQLLQRRHDPRPSGVVVHPPRQQPGSIPTAPARAGRCTAVVADRSRPQATF